MLRRIRALIGERRSGKDGNSTKQADVVEVQDDDVQGVADPVDPPIPLQGVSVSCSHVPSTAPSRPVSSNKTPTSHGSHRPLRRFSHDQRPLQHHPQRSGNYDNHHHADDARGTCPFAMHRQAPRGHVQHNSTSARQRDAAHGGAVTSSSCPFRGRAGGVGGMECVSGSGGMECVSGSGGMDKTGVGMELGSADAIDMLECMQALSAKLEMEPVLCDVLSHMDIVRLQVCFLSLSLSVCVCARVFLCVFLHAAVYFCVCMCTYTHGIHTFTHIHIHITDTFAYVCTG